MTAILIWHRRLVNCRPQFRPSGEVYHSRRCRQ